MANYLKRLTFAKRIMIDKGVIETAYCFFHQKQRVYQYSTMDWQKDDIEYAIDDYVSQFGYGIVRDLVGHGIGEHLHEDPQIPNFRQRRRGIKLVPGMTLAIEPMINAGTWEVVWLDDDWTVVTEDGSLSAHYENTVLITDGEPEILTLSL